jgi:hypothetical protein
LRCFGQKMILQNHWIEKLSQTYGILKSLS